MARRSLSLTKRVTRTGKKQKTTRRFKIATRSTIQSALLKTSKRFLVSLVMNLLGKVSRSAKISALARIERAPKKSTGRKRKRRSTARKSRRRKAKSRKGKSKRSKASIRAQRLRNLKKARAAKKRKSR